ncbi:hypothetical protein ACFLV5_05970 [Chloroflexota bacterium]
MKIINKMASKLGLRKRRYYTLMVRPDDYITVKALAGKLEMTHVDFVHKLLYVYFACQEKNHEKVIADLEKKQDVLVDELKIYMKRFGKIYNTPADKTHIGSGVDMKQ